MVEAVVVTLVGWIVHRDDLSQHWDNSRTNGVTTLRFRSQRPARNCEP